MDGFGLDLRLAVRALVRRPAYTAVSALTLALGIGAATGVFSAVHAVLLSALPYPEPERLVYGIATHEGRTTGFSGPDCADYIERSTSFSALAAHLQYSRTVALTGRERPEHVEVTYASGGLFRALGVAPAVGRTFTAEECAPVAPAGPDASPAGPPAAIVSHRFWQARLGGAPDVVGSRLTLEGASVPVVGVMPEGFRFLTDADVWLPMQPGGFAAGQRRFHNWLLVGRLRRGVTIEQARAELEAIAADLERTYPESNTGMGVRLTPLHETLVSRVRPALLLVMAAVVLMLLIACGNVANLTMARAASRRGELAIRVALGASRARLVRQLVTESVAVALLGGAAGLLVAIALLRVMPHLLELGGSRLTLERLTLEPAVLAFSVALALLAGVGVGLGPALRGAARAPREELQGARALTSRPGMRARLALVGLQVALSLVLVLGAALLMRSFSRLMGVALGFDASHVLTSSLSLPASVSRDEAVEFFSGLLGDIGALSGVTGAGAVSRLPIATSGGSSEVWTPEHPELRSFSRQALGRVVLQGYFDAMGMRLLAGRDFDDRDAAGAEPVVVVTEATARLLFEGEEGGPIGRTVVVDGTPEISLRVVGVLADARIEELAREPMPVLYLPYAQFPRAAMSVAIRTQRDSAAIAAALRELVARRRLDVPVQEPATMTEIVRSSTVAQRALSAIVGGFAGFALLLAGVGLYGVLAFQVDERRHEIGLRMALGALGARVLSAVLRQTLGVTAAGLVAGLAVSLALARLMASQLYGVAPHDPGCLVAAVGCLLAVAVVACLLPALRALRVQPMAALRRE